MTDYRITGYRKFPDKKMRQIVVYLRKTDSELVYQNSFRLSKTYHEFEVIRLWEQPTDKFMNLPGLLPFVVLSQTKELTMVLNEVAKAVETITYPQVEEIQKSIQG